MNKLLIQAKYTRKGIAIAVNSQKYEFGYPQKVWQSFPTAYKNLLAQTAAYFFTFHLGVEKPLTLHYKFPPPPMYSLFLHGFLYAIAATNYEMPNQGLLPPKLVKQVYNNGFLTQFSGINRPLAIKFYKAKLNTAIVPFTFGKDSLLTLTLCQKLGIKPELFFFAEPLSIYENEEKLKLIGHFEKEFKLNINIIENTLGELKKKGGQMWGWDLIISQYTLLLLPYLQHKRSQYFFWSHEQSVNLEEGKDHGYLINITHEQGTQWMLHLNNLLHSFGSSAVLGSLLEPLHEIIIMYILHRQFPEVGKYQHSCFGDKKSEAGSRWCGRCYECARVYLFLLAVGRQPKEVGFTQNLFDASRKEYYLVFGEQEIRQPGKTVWRYGERILAFYLAYLKGVRGGVMDMFEKYFLEAVMKNKQKLVDRYFNIYPAMTIPHELDQELKHIFQDSIQRFKSEIS